MTLKTEWLRYGADREHLGLVAYPERAAQPLPSIVVLQEIWGVDEHIEDVTKRYAQAGYVAFAPDLWAKGGERPATMTRDRMAEVQAFMNVQPMAVWGDTAARDAAIAKLPAPQGKRISETFNALFVPLFTGGMKFDQYVPQLVEAAKFLRGSFAPSRGRKVAAMGYCMGGALAALMAAADPELAGAIVLYGNAPTDEQIAKIRCPVLGLYGGLDTRVNAGIPAFAEAMKKHGKSFESHIYEGAQHAFFNDARPAYDANAARDAFVRTLSFLARTLT